jgi:RNA 3'-terminal phosphate cyclase (ATP)
MASLLEIDGSRYSGSGTIVRQAVLFSALTGRPIHLVNARVRRDNPGLRLQHIRVVQAISDLVDGKAEGLTPGSKELVFRPGQGSDKSRYLWDIGSAGSTTMLAIAVLPALAFRSRPAQVELRGGLFQDFAPSFYHLQYVLQPLLLRFGIHARITMLKPGYVPRGEGVLQMDVTPAIGPFRSIRLDAAGPVSRLWGVALASHLEERRVAQRMADAANRRLAQEGFQADIEVRNDLTACQRGAGLALFADLEGGARLGADRAGALGRPAEAIGPTLPNIS